MQNWHSVPLAEIFSEIKSGKEGLAAEEAVKRIKESGRNILPQEKPYSKIRLFFGQFHTPLMYILLTVTAISFLLKHYPDTIFIITVLLINTIVGFYQENKANKSLSALKRMVRIKTRVFRNGNEKEIDSEELAAGDIIILKAGDKVPADGRIIESSNLKINEASLTGEWLAVEKEARDILPEATPLSERLNMAFMGTTIETGKAAVIVTATGINTEIGKIVSLLRETKERRTPLQRKILFLSKITAAFILAIVSLLVILGYIYGQSFAEIFISALALAVSAIPEGLLPAITVILVLGTRRILKQNGLVRKLIATETLGSVTVICTDKTGTLTEGKMRVSHILTSTRELLDDGINGMAKGEQANGIESHISALKIATLTNEAFVENPEAELEEWIIRGSPTEQALLLAGMQSGLNKKELEKQYPVADQINFQSDLKYSATFHRSDSGKYFLYVLGAPEIIIKHSLDLDVDGRKEKLGSVQSEKLLNKFEELANKGLRVLACAHKDFSAPVKYKNLTELVDDLTLVGFIALKDPLRKDAKESIEIAKKAGIRTVIVTGDHKLTAKTIAEEIGLEAEEKNILEGKDIETMQSEILKEKAKDISIYARVTPGHKLRIVEALQANGEIVAMLGDGVNDAPALKSADIGVAVGSGTDIAKETADLVLLDDNFKTILKAIEQGRVIFENIRKVFIYLIADDFAEIFLFLGSILFGFPLPLLAAQILWINVVEDGLPNVALTTEQETKGLMEEKPRNPKEPLLNKPMKLWMVAIFLITGLAAFLTFAALQEFTYDQNKIRTIVFALVGFDSLLFAFSIRSFKRPVFRKDILSNKYLTGAAAAGLLLLIAALYLPILQKLLATSPLGILEWLIILGVSILEIILIEFFKKKFFQQPLTQSLSG